MRLGAPRRRWLIYLAAAGPGLIAAAAGNDAGGIVTYSSAGAQFVYRTLFLMVLITVAYVVVQEMVARLAVHTGKGLAALIREEFDLRLTAFAITAFAIANVGLMVTEFGGIATAFELFGVSRYISVPIAAVAIWSLVLFGSYRYAERVFLLLTVVFIAYPIAAVLAHPDWKAVAANTVWPHFVASKSFLLLSVALIGTTITPYIQLYEAGAVVDKGVKPAEYRFQRVDADHRRRAGRVRRHVDHRGHRCHHRRHRAAHLGHHGGQGPRAGGRRRRPRPSSASACSGRPPWPRRWCRCRPPTPWPRRSASSARSRRASARPRSSWASSPSRSSIGAAVVLVPGNLITLILNTQVLEGVITPMTLILILILANRRSLLGSAANGPSPAGSVAWPSSRWPPWPPSTSCSPCSAGSASRLTRPAPGPLAAGAVCAGPGRSGRLCGHVGPSRDIHCLRLPARSGSRPRNPGSGRRHIEVPAPLPAAPPRPGGLRVAYLTYRGNPRCGGQGVYTRHLTRELVALGHSVEVFSGPPWPELDEGVGFTPVPGLDLYRDPDPFRFPHPREFHDRARTGSSSASCARPASASRWPSRGGSASCWRSAAATSTSSTTTSAWATGMLGMVEDGWPLLTTLHHPITVDRQLALAHTTNPWQRFTTRRWFGFLGHAGAAWPGRCPPS